MKNYKLIMAKKNNTYQKLTDVKREPIASVGHDDSDKNVEVTDVATDKVAANSNRQNVQN